MTQNAPGFRLRGRVPRGPGRFPFILIACLTGTSTALALRPDATNPRASVWRYQQVLETAPRAITDSSAHSGQLRAGRGGNDAQFQSQWWLGESVRLGMEVLSTSRGRPNEVLGTNGNRSGRAGRVSQGFVEWEGRNLGLLFGRDHLSSERDRLNELGLSREALPTDLLRYHLRTSDGRLRLEVQEARLLSYGIKGDFNRYLAEQRLTWRPGRWLESVSIGDYVIFTGADRPFELAYLNPVNPFFVITFEGYTHANVNGADIDSSYRSDSDNNMAFLEWETPLKTLASWRWRHYGEIVVDEFQIDRFSRKLQDDIFGLNLGLETRHGLGRRGQLRTQAELTFCSTWLYIHSGQETNWFDRHRLLGNQEGGDTRKAALRLQWWPRGESGVRAGDPALAQLRYDWIQQGEIGIDSTWDPASTKQDSAPSGLETITHRLTLGGQSPALRLRRLPQLAAYLGVEGRREWVFQARHQRGQRDLHQAFWVRATLQWEF